MKLFEIEFELQSIFSSLNSEEEKIMNKIDSVYNKL